MKLTRSQRELLHQWHRLDQAAGCRQWRAAQGRDKIAAPLLHAGMLQGVPLEFCTYYRLTDEAVNLLKGGES